jgi:hypothetical protein
LFDQNNYATSNHAAIKRLASAATELLTLGDQIESLRAELIMEPFALRQRYLAYRAMRGPNTPGEPKLARAFLEELAEYVNDQGTAP